MIVFPNSASIPTRPPRSAARALSKTSRSSPPSSRTYPQVSSMMSSSAGAIFIDVAPPGVYDGRGIGEAGIRLGSRER